ncbi:hypothetical protein BC830DRAFT_339916 [Chytriomyces sp. MP71]|nr:hypothetical protein BC830DRAFT_339916 [Chytriomyces sp. MP71]
MAATSTPTKLSAQSSLLNLRDPDHDEGAIGAAILQKYRDGDSISNFFRNLSFPFAESLHLDNITCDLKIDTLSYRRLRYHRMTESLRDQIVWMAIKLKQVSDRFSTSEHPLFKVGLLLSDILPETGEFYCKMPFFEPRQIVILGRRNDLLEWIHRKHKGVQTVWDWENKPESMAGLSIVAMLTSSMHVTLIEEQARGHNLSKVVIVSAVPGTAPKRVSSLLKSKLVVPLYWSHDETHSSDTKTQDITWSPSMLTKGSSLPDIGSCALPFHI